MITVTCVRHGESTDNLLQVWAGWKDAPLSQHGMNQARAIGEYFSAPSTGVKIHAIYASPLLRAFTTAQQIQTQQPSEPKPPLVPTDLLKEQYWGDAEGHPFTWDRSPPSGSAEADAKDEGIRDRDGKYAPLTSRTSRFPNGESSEDVAHRVDNFISQYITPHVLASLPDEEEPLNIFVVSHGIAISELIGALLRRDSSRASTAPETWRGLRNTGWTRIIVGLQQDTTVDTYDAGKEIPSSTSLVPRSPEEGNGLDTGAQVATLVESSHPPPTNTNKPKDPPLNVRITLVNQYSHLDNLNRQKGGIGNSAYDPKQSSIKDFFGGGDSSSKI